VALYPYPHRIYVGTWLHLLCFDHRAGEAATAALYIGPRRGHSAQPHTPSDHRSVKHSAATDEALEQLVFVLPPAGALQPGPGTGPLPGTLPVDLHRPCLVRTSTSFSELKCCQHITMTPSVQAGV
jgi:hypothetical protein